MTLALQMPGRYGMLQPGIEKLVGMSESEAKIEKILSLLNTHLTLIGK